MVAAIGALRKRSPPELTGENDERCIEQTTRFQVRNQSRNRLIHRPGIIPVIRFEAAVGVPSLKAVHHRDRQFDEPHAAFHHPPGNDAFAGVGAGVDVVRVHSIKPLRRLGLAGKVEQFRNGRLHSRCEFGVCDGALKRVLAAGRFEAESVQPRGEAAFRVLLRGEFFARCNVRKRRSVDVQQRSLMARREKAAAKTIKAAGWYLSAIQHNEIGEVTVERTESVRNPRAHAGTPLQPETAVQKIVRARVLGESGCH